MKFKDKPSRIHEAYCRAETYYYKTSKDDVTPCDVYRNITLYDKLDNIVLLTEIQLENIVDRLGKESATGTYELLPEYERGEKKMSCTKAMNWEGKT